MLFRQTSDRRFLESIGLRFELEALTDGLPDRGSHGGNFGPEGEPVRLGIETSTGSGCLGQQAPLHQLPVSLNQALVGSGFQMAAPLLPEPYL